MPRQIKRWEDHSPRWQREHAKAGESAKRWNGYLKLSEKSQKAAEPRRYAQGESVAEQRRSGYESAAFHTMAVEMMGREASVRESLENMTTAQLRWTATATAAQISARARDKRYRNENGRPIWGYK